MIHPSHSFNPNPFSPDTAAFENAALWRRAVLIGTDQTLPPLIEQLAALTDYPAPLGCLLPTHEGQTHIDGVPVLGTFDTLAALHARQPLTLAVMSLPASMAAAILGVRSRLRALGVVERFVTPLVEMLDRPPSVNAGASVDMVELIGRAPYGLDRRSVAKVLENKRVLITGAGGSIGSELARLAATMKPSLLILMERSENALFEIDRTIARRFPDVPRKALLHDIVDAQATRRRFEELKPDTVFHAAAHKHVPLMEDHPAHAVTNNVLGTRSVACACVAAGTQRLVMISSDKAVNPTSVMGATKRLAEMVIQDMNRRQDVTRMSMVRFGNVLGSACSVLPIWTSQLAEGGPITVTDERMTRYFMTIHEAATLVIQSAAIDAPKGSSAPVHVLDMDEPVKILDLARRFVAMHAFESRVIGPHTAMAPSDPARPAVDIRLTGIRPGEKLHEELAYAAEALDTTPYPGIRAWRGELAASFSADELVETLSKACSQPDNYVVATIRRLVPEMAAAGSGTATGILESKRTPNKSKVGTDRAA